MKTKQHSQAITIENLKSETSWEFNALLIKDTECILGTFIHHFREIDFTKFSWNWFHEIYNQFFSSEDEIGQCITILGTFIHQEPSLVAPLLPEILLTVTRIARNTQYSWELDSFTFVPSNSRSIARQVCITLKP